MATTTNKFYLPEGSKIEKIIPIKNVRSDKTKEMINHVLHYTTPTGESKTMNAILYNRSTALKGKDTLLLALLHKKDFVAKRVSQYAESWIFTA